MREDATLAAAIVEMSGKGMGMTASSTPATASSGIFTDGDLRRGTRRTAATCATSRVAALMTRTPRTIEPARLAVDCVE